MFNLVVATAFKNIYKSIKIALYICVWISDGISYPSLSSEIDNSIKVSICKQHLHCVGVFKIHPDKTETRVFCGFRELIPCHFIFRDSEFEKPSIFQVRVIVIIDIVESDNRIPRSSSFLLNKAADKSGSSCY